MDSIVSAEDFAKIYTAYGPKLQQYLYLLLYRERSDRIAKAEDLLQETFKRAWERRSDYRGEASVATWIFSIARSKILQYRRFLSFQKRDPEKEMDILSESQDWTMLGEKLAVPPDQEIDLLRTEIMGRLTVIVASRFRREEHRFVFWAHLFRPGVTIRDIGQEVGLKENAARTVIFRINDYLRTDHRAEVAKLFSVVS